MTTILNWEVQDYVSAFYYDENQDIHLTEHSNYLRILINSHSSIRESLEGGNFYRYSVASGDYSIDADDPIMGNVDIFIPIDNLSGRGLQQILALFYKEFIPDDREDAKNLDIADSLLRNARDDDYSFLRFSADQFQPDYDSTSLPIGMDKLMVFSVGDVVEQYHNRATVINPYLKNISNSTIEWNKLDESVPSILADWYHLPIELAEIYPTIDKVLSGSVGISFKIFLVGKPGSGKSDFARALSEHYGIPLAKLNLAKGISEPTDLFYHRGLETRIVEGNDGGYYSIQEDVYRPTEFAQVLSEDTDSPVIILVDEINRAGAFGINPLMPIFDGQREFTIGVNTFNFDRPIVFVITANVGNGHVGTDLMDIAFKRRFHAHIEMSTPDGVLFYSVAKEYWGNMTDSFGEPANDLSEIQLAILTDVVYNMAVESDELGTQDYITIGHLQNVLDMVFSGVAPKAAIRNACINAQDNDDIRKKLEDLVVFHQLPDSY